MKRFKINKGLFIIGLIGCSFTLNAQPMNLKQALTGKFYIGTAMNAEQIEGKDTAALRVINQHFNAIVAENCMKMGPIHPKEKEYDFSLADKMVEYGEKHQLVVTGHNLVWHSQAPSWFFKDENGNEVSREILIERMKSHIFTVVSRYKGRIKGWDVVNEAMEDNGSYRKSKFFQIIGEDFIKLAFQFAHEADPQAELYYNDYSLANPVKRKAVIAMVKKLKDQGVKIDAIGEQCHVGIDSPAIEDFEKMIQDFEELKVKVMITEMDIVVLPMDWSLGSDVSARVEYKKKSDLYPHGLPDSVSTALNDRYLSFFKLFLKYRNTISRVTLWGTSDQQSWKNNWPIPGRTDYPLLFDRNFRPKNAVYQIIKEASKY